MTVYINKFNYSNDIEKTKSINHKEDDGKDLINYFDKVREVDKFDLLKFHNHEK
jgi:hypothetical protein